jgi:putative oxidoreductase
MTHSQNTAAVSGRHLTGVAGTPDSLWIDRGLLLLRVALGLVFIAHGAQKLFMMGIPNVAGFLGQLGVPFPGLNAVLLVAVELGGGLLLAAGALTRAASLLTAAAMAVATLLVHAPNGFFLPNGVEFTLTLMLASLALTMTGAGRYSVDAALASRTASLPAPVQRVLKTAA